MGWDVFLEWQDVKVYALLGKTHLTLYPVLLPCWEDHKVCYVLIASYLQLQLYFFDLVNFQRPEKGFFWSMAVVKSTVLIAIDFLTPGSDGHVGSLLVMTACD